MVVPWSGFAMAELVKLARPKADAKYVRMETFENPDVATGQRQSWYPWPYVEGAHHGGGDQPARLPRHRRLRQAGAGAERRAAAPGAAVEVRLQVRSSRWCASPSRDERPVSFWEELAGAEYGFWANVNPEVPHPRWSQAMEKPLGADEKIPTLLYNGYAEEVAGLYTGLEGERIYF